MVVVVQLFMIGLYLPPVFNGPPPLAWPPHTIISLPVHTAVCWDRACGELLVLVASLYYEHDCEAAPSNRKKVVILGALRGGFVNALGTDDVTAHAVLAEADKTP